MDVARTPRRPARAETVGSLLRPKELREAIDRFYVPGHSAVLEQERAKDRAELLALEDEAIRSAVQRQIDCGLDVVTDGEFRRWMFLNSFYDAVDGMRTGKTVAFRNDRGEDVRAEHPRDRRIDSRRSIRPAAREAAFMTGSTGGHPFKVTFPAASIFGHPLTTVSGPDDGGVRLARGVRRRMRSRSNAGWSPTRSRPAPDTCSSISPSIRTWSTRRGSNGSTAPVTTWNAVLDAARSRPTPPCWRASPTTSRRRSTSAEGTTGRRGCARARWSRSPSAYSASCRTTRSWSSGTTWAATADSSRSGSSGRARRW